MLKHVPLYLAIALATACSSDSDSSSSGDPAFDPSLDGSGDPDLDPSGEPGPPASDTAPSNDALLASGGEVTIEQAADLSLGRWTETHASTGCTTTYVLDDGVFQKTSLDQTAAGFYDFFDDDGGVEIEFDYEQDNFGSDCRGFSGQHAGGRRVVSAVHHLPGPRHHGAFGQPGRARFHREVRAPVGACPTFARTAWRA